MTAQTLETFVGNILPVFDKATRKDMFLLSVFILWFTYYVSDIFSQLNDHLSGKSCSFGLPSVPFVNCCQFMYLVISLLVLRAGYGI